MFFLPGWISQISPSLISLEHDDLGKSTSCRSTDRIKDCHHQCGTQVFALQYYADQLDTLTCTTCSAALNSRVPDSSQMEPGRVYIGRLPNHNRPVFVRRRKHSFLNPFGVPSVTSIYASAPTTPMEYQYNTAVVCQPSPPPPVLISQPPTYMTPAQVVQPPPHAQIGTTITTTTTRSDHQPQQAPSKHTCAACGKFRSARYHYRHPIAPGESPRPTLCRKCVKKHTSSEESEEMERARWRKKDKEREGYRRRQHRSESSEEWSSSSSHEERHRRHQYRSLNESRTQRRSTQSGSGASTRIYIIRRPEVKPRPRSSSDNIRIIRRFRSSEEPPGILRHSRNRYSPYDGHYSYEDYHSDEEVEEDPFDSRGRSRTRTLTRRSIDASHSVDEDYVRVSTSTSRRRPLGFLDRLSRSRPRSISRSHSRWGRHGSASFEDESVRISIRSREPSPLHYERHEEEYEERTSRSDMFPWRRQSDSMLVRQDTTLESRRDDYFGRPSITYSGHVYDSRRLGGRSLFRPRSARTVGLYSPERRVRFARSRSSSLRRGQHRERRLCRRSSDEGFPSAGM